MNIARWFGRETAGQTAAQNETASSRTPEQHPSSAQTRLEAKIDAQIAQKKKDLQALDGAYDHDNDLEVKRLQDDLDALQHEKDRVHQGEFHLGERIGAEVRGLFGRNGRLRHLGEAIVSKPLEVVKNVAKRIRSRKAAAPAAEVAQPDIEDDGPEEFSDAEAALHVFNLLVKDLRDALDDIQKQLFPDGNDDYSDNSEPARQYRIWDQKLKAIKKKMDTIVGQYMNDGRVVAGKETVCLRKMGDYNEELGKLAGEVVGGPELPLEARLATPVGKDDSEEKLRRRLAGVRDRLHLPDHMPNMPARPDFLRRGERLERTQGQLEEIHPQLGQLVDYLVAGANARYDELRSQLKALMEAEAENPRPNHDEYLREFRVLEDEYKAAFDDRRAYDALQAEYRRLSDRLMAIDVETEDAPGQMAEILAALRKLEEKIDVELSALPRVGRLRRLGRNVAHAFMSSPQVTAKLILDGTDLSDALFMGAANIGIRAALGPVGLVGGTALSIVAKSAGETRRMDRALKSGNEDAVEDAMVTKYARLVNPGAFHKHQLDQREGKPSRLSEAGYYFSRGIGFLAQFPDRRIQEISMGLGRKENRWGAIIEKLKLEVPATEGITPEALAASQAEALQAAVDKWLQDRITEIDHNRDVRNWEEVNQDIDQLNRLLTDAVDLDFFTDIGLEHFRARGERARLVTNEAVEAIMQVLDKNREALQKLLAGYPGDQEVGFVGRGTRKALENLRAMLADPDQYRRDRALRLLKRMRVGDVLAILVKAGLTEVAANGMGEILEGRHHEVVTEAPQGTAEPSAQPIPVAPSYENSVPPLSTVTEHGVPPVVPEHGIPPLSTVTEHGVPPVVTEHVPPLSTVVAEHGPSTVDASLATDANPAEVWRESREVSIDTIKGISPGSVVEEAERAAAVIRENPATAANLRSYLEVIPGSPHLTDAELSLALTNYLRNPNLGEGLDIDPNIDVRALIDRMAYGVPLRDADNNIIPVTWNEINIARQALGLEAVPINQE